MRFCVRNPKPCPLLEVTDTGSPRPTTLGARRRPTDRPAALPRVPRRRNRRRADGRDAVLARRSRRLSCSGARSRSNGRSPPPACPSPTSSKASTSRCTSRIVAASARGHSRVRWWCRCGRSHLRTFARAVEVCRRFPAMHGGPVHIGDPAALGIADLDAPDFGDPVRIDPGEVPVFWACGVTPQAVARRCAAVVSDLPRAGPHVHHRSTPRRIRLSGGAAMTIHDGTDQHGTPTRR